MKEKYFVYVNPRNGAPHFEYDRFACLADAEMCAETLNNGDAAHDFGWRFYVWCEN